jgi:transglutaminase-like putative cysteine protease
MSPRRDLTLAFGGMVLLLGLLPAYGRVFAQPDWRGPALAAGALAIALAAGVRRVRGGIALSTLVTVVGLACFTYVVHLPTEGLLPGPDQLREVAVLLTEANEQLRGEPAPAQPLPGLVLLVTTGFWIVGFCVHELLVRWGRPGLALVPAVVLWAVPLAIPQAETTTWPTALAFLAAAGLVLLLAADAETSPEDRVPSASAAGLTIGSAAVALAVLAPGLLPGYGAEAWVELGGARDPRGYQPIVDVTERLQLPEERDVLRVRAEQRTYLRLAGLDGFDGGTWRLGAPGQTSYQPEADHLHPTRGELPEESPARATTPLEAEVEVLALENIYVPVPYQPRRIEGPDRDEMVWSTEGGFLATWATEGDEQAGEGEGEPRVGVRPGFSYRVSAERPTPSIEQLRREEATGEPRERFTQLPADYDELREQAEALYAAAGATTDVDRALALQDWFAGPDSPFNYSLEVEPLRDDGALRDFVLDSQVGYCEYFATAMAVMLRATDVPARVAVGFLPGRVSEQADPDDPAGLTEFTVSTSDAHAWVEVFFPEHGWVTFEPTPRDDETQMMPRPDDLAPTENERERREREQAVQDEGEDEDEAADAPSEFDAPQLPDEGAIDQPDEGLAGAPERRWPLAVLAAALLGGAAIAVARTRRRAEPLAPGPAGRVVGAQRALLAAAAGYGLGRRPTETFREVVARWGAEGRVDDRGPRLASLTGAAAFGGAVDDEQAGEAERLAGDVREMLRDSIPPRQRLLAPVRQPLEAAGARLRDGLSRTRRLLRRG